MTIDHESRAIDVTTEALRATGPQTFGVLRFRREPGPWVLRAACVYERQLTGFGAFATGPVPDWTITFREGGESAVYQREWNRQQPIRRDWSQQFTTSTLDVAVRVNPIAAAPTPERITAVVWFERGPCPTFHQWGGLWIKPNVAAAQISILGGEDMAIPRNAQALETVVPAALDVGGGVIPFAGPVFVVQLGPAGTEVARYAITSTTTAQRIPLHFAARWCFLEGPLVLTGNPWPVTWEIHG